MVRRGGRPRLAHGRCTLAEWPLRIALSRLRPLNAVSGLRTAIILFLGAAFLYGDYALFRRIFSAIADVEAQTPFFALGLLRNLLSLVFLTASVILFSSSLTTAIGSFFTDLDLDIYHSAPRSRFRIALTRWTKTLAQSAAVVFLFLLPLFVAFEQRYPAGWSFFPVVLLNLALLLSIPVSLASAIILTLVRWFPVRRVHQIVATLAVLVLTTIVIAFRVSRPERFFTEVSTHDVARVLQSIELPSMSVYPSTALAELVTRDDATWLAPRIAITAAIAFAIFAFTAWRWYFVAFVRGRESMAPVAMGAAWATRRLDRLVARADPQIRAMLGKEIRTVTRDVAQWSQLLLMVALLFIYLYNIRMLPLGGDARATLVAYANLGMSGFVVAAICLRFAYPSVSTEGKAFWMLQTAPISYRHFILVKVLVYSAPLTLLSLLLTAFANVILNASSTIWLFTLAGASMLAITLVSLGVGLGALSPDFNAENPLQVGLSLGGFAYMAVSMGYVAVMMILMARPVMRFLFERVLRISDDLGMISATIPIVIALTTSALLSVIPLHLAERKLARVHEND